VGGPGLPTNLEDEAYLCYFEDSNRQFNITVPAVVVTSGTNYTCNITNQVPNFMGVNAGKVKLLSLTDQCMYMQLV